MAAWLVIGPLSWLTRETQHSRLLTFFCSWSQSLPAQPCNSNPNLITMSWIISDLELFSISLEIGWASWQGPAEKRLLVRPFYKQTLSFTDWQIIINPSVKAQRAIKRKRWESLKVVCRTASGKERHFELRRDRGVCVSCAFWGLWDIFHSVAQKEWRMIPVVSSQRKVKGDTVISEDCGRTTISLLLQKQGKTKKKNRWQWVSDEKCYWGPDVEGNDFSDQELHVTTPRLSWSHKVNDWILWLEGKVRRETEVHESWRDNFPR